METHQRQGDMVANTHIWILLLNKLYCDKKIEVCGDEMEEIKIGKACDILNGFAFKSENYVDEGIRVIRIANVQKGYIEDNTPAFYPIETKGIEKYMLNEGDLLMSLTGNVGRVAILEKDLLPAALNQRVACLRLKTDKIEKGYLYHILNSDFFEKKCIQASNGVAQKNMSTEWLKDFSIPVYSKETQRRITTILDKLRLIIDSRKKELDKLDGLIKARFVEMFGLIERPVLDFPREVLKNLCNKITDGKHGGCSQEDGTERYFVGAREIYDDAVHYDTAPQINVEEFEKDYKRCNVEKGDFLIVNTGATIGKSAIAIDERTEHTLLQKSVALLKTKRDILHPVFLKFCYLVNDKMYKVESASAQPNLLLSKINATEIYVPPMSLQEEFVDFVVQIDKSKVAIQKSLEKTQLLFDSLMQKYFG